MITYNHGKFIRNAVESVIMQKGNFDLELIIGDDLSTDNTREIVMEYYEKYPEIIKLNFHEKNVGANNNFKSTLEKCTGKYVAILEGDDYWIDENKLQMQIDFLEKNKDYSMCFTKTKFLYDEDNRVELQEMKNIKEYYITEDLIKENFIFHLTCLFRNKDIQEYPEWLWKYKILDYPMHLLRSIDGKIGYIDRITSMYRIHGRGMTRSNNKSWWYVQLSEFMNEFNKYTSYKYDKEVKKKIRRYDAYIAAYDTNYYNALEGFKKSLLYNLSDFTVTKKKLRFIANSIRGKYEKN